MDVLCSERRAALAGRQVVFAGFSITPHTDDDKAIVEFDNPHNAVIFALKKPEYIHHEFDRSLI